MAYKFKAAREKDNIIAWIKNYFADNCGSAAVVGMSGGKDSTVVAALCVEALGKENVIGVLLPRGEQRDIEVARDICDWLGIYRHEFNIEPIVDSFDSVLKPDMINIEEEGMKRLCSNLPARVRMTMLYGVAAVEHGRRVACTSNASENYIGYSTKYGDHAGDFAPLWDYTATEVIQIGRELGIPDEYLFKTPEDGLSGLTDEENLGFSYKILDEYIREGTTPDFEVLTKIKKLNTANLHKLHIYLPHPGATVYYYN